MSDIVTADIFDVHHASLEVCELQFRSFGQRRSFFGPCSTLSAFEDHTPVLRALSEPGRNRVLVVDGKGSLRVGLISDRLAAIGADNGWAGVVISAPLGIGAQRIGSISHARTRWALALDSAVPILPLSGRQDGRWAFGPHSSTWFA